MKYYVHDLHGYAKWFYFNHMFLVDPNFIPEFLDECSLVGIEPTLQKPQ